MSSAEGHPNARTLLLATDCASMRSLAKALDADLEALASFEDAEGFERWRAEAAGRPARTRIVVCVWNDEPVAQPLVDLEEDAWERRFERPYLLWNGALGLAARRCATGGTIVALVQTPAALDAAGFSLEMSTGDGVVALVRSLAASEGGRGVRVNCVTTPIPLVAHVEVAPAPPLALFPGALEVEVAGALRLALSLDAGGLTGRVFAADGGRSLS